MLYRRLLIILLFPLFSSAAEGESGQSAFLIRNVNLVSMLPDEEPVQAGQSVLIENEKITAIAPVGSLPAEPGLTVIDGQGQYLIPGLTDAHVHIWDKAELNAYLAYGVTAVRNASGMPFHLTYAAEIDAGDLTGPFLITTGPILNSPGPNQQPNHKIVMTAEEAIAAVRDQYDQGFRHLKVYSNLSRMAYEAVLSEAENLGMTVMGHSPEGLREEGIPLEKPFNIGFEEIIDDGFITLEHTETIVWHGLYDDLDEERFRLLAKQIAQNRNAVTPTLLAHHNLGEVSWSDGEFLKRQGTDMLNPFISALEQPVYDFWASQGKDARREFDQFYGRATAIMHEEGVLLLAGSDAGIFTNIPGESLIDELELLVAGGLTPYQAIQAATFNAGLRLPLEGRGVIGVGRPADLVLVAENPLENVLALRTLSGVMAQGKWYDSSALAELRKLAADTSVERTQQQVMEGLAAQGTSLE